MLGKMTLSNFKKLSIFIFIQKFHIEKEKFYCSFLSPLSFIRVCTIVIQHLHDSPDESVNETIFRLKGVLQLDFIIK